MSQPATPEYELLPADGLSEDLRHKAEGFIEGEEGSFKRCKRWLAAGLQGWLLCRPRLVPSP